jgi:hypothetical protein
MTAQIMDRVAYGAREHVLAGINGVGMFDPKAHGLSPVMISTACYRGWYARYTIRADQLLLTQLNIGVDGDEELAFQGRAARRYTVRGQEEIDGKWVDADLDPGDRVIDGLELAVPFTGSMLIGADFIHEHYVHMGFRPAWTFETVHELELDRGVLTRTTNCSEKLAAVRARIGHSLDQPASREDLARWIAACFSQKY